MSTSSSAKMLWIDLDKSIERSRGLQARSLECWHSTDNPYARIAGQIQTIARLKAVDGLVKILKENL